jgi:hypothetical protein
MKRLLWFASTLLVARGLFALYEDFQRRSQIRVQTKDLQTWEGEGGNASESPASARREETRS